MSHIKVEFNCPTVEKKEILIAILSEINFDGFEEDELLLNAFISRENFIPEVVAKIAVENNISYSIFEIPETNWNRVWETNFQPVIIENFVMVRADFHTPVGNVEHEIIINPKMSFGTGHHETTYMMMQLMQGINFHNKTVFDFGTGTGILSILSEKLGAAKVFAVDNDTRCIDNATENIFINKCSSIRLSKDSGLSLEFKFDIILSNITRNVILKNFETMYKQLLQNGIILLSGLLREDIEIVLQEIGKYPLKIVEQITKKDWISLRLDK